MHAFNGVNTPSTIIAYALQYITLFAVKYQGLQFYAESYNKKTKFEFCFAKY